MNDLASLIERLGYPVQGANDITGRDILIGWTTKDSDHRKTRTVESNQ